MHPEKVISCRHYGDYDGQTGLFFTVGVFFEKNILS